MGKAQQAHSVGVSYEPMTVERLRKHLFGGPQVPFWNFDPAQLTAGIEIEYFIARVHGDSFTLASQAQYMAVIGHLMRDAGYRDRGLPDQPGRVSRDTEQGFIAIMPDYAWHILEISFPPRRTTDELRVLLTSVFREVDAALAREGLERLDLSCLPEPPETMELVRLDRLALTEVTFNQKVAGRPTIDPRFPAYLAATHVHLNASSEDSLKLLPRLYEMEPLAMDLFCRARHFAGCATRNARTDLYADTLGHDYPLHTIPKKVPCSLGDLVQAMNSAKPLFPNDHFFPVRDMSYIRPSRYGTLEFRSTCSYPEVGELLEIALWRKIQMVAAWIEPDCQRVVLERLSDATGMVARGGENEGLIRSVNGHIRRLWARDGRSHALLPS